MSVYLVLNAASLVKERALKEKEEFDKMKKNIK
jgi:hypothetical protein